MANHKSVLKKTFNKIDLEKDKIDFIKKESNKFLREIRKIIKNKKLSISVFIGGSFAKNTLIKKDVYDVDIFLRFDKKYSQKDFSGICKKILSSHKFFVVHGSRDYFKIQVNPWFCFEIVPVRRVSNPRKAENITDLSYSHVNYIKKKIKEKKIFDEIKIAKAFCYANGTYGAESYINGFSGYSLELLILHYGSFMKMIKSLSKNFKEKLIIDIEKHYKKKSDILLDLNGAKLESPIILIDPTYKERNALAALSSETFKKFQKSARKFLKNPSIKNFEIKKIDLDKIKKNSKGEFLLVDIETSKQKGDVAGSKLLKFYKHLNLEISKFFKITKKGFSYDQGNGAKAFFVLKPKKEIIFSGPKKDDKKNVLKFRKKHGKIFEKRGFLISKEKVDFSGKEFLKKWSRKNRRRIKEMYIEGLRIYS